LRRVRLRRLVFGDDRLGSARRIELSGGRPPVVVASNVTVLAILAIGDRVYVASIADSAMYSIAK
jgi:hypothetical protein